MSGLAAVQARIAEIQGRFPSALAVQPSAVPAARTSAGTSTGAASSAAAFSSALAGADTTLTLPASAALPSTAPGAPRAGGGPTGEAVVAAARKYLGVPYLWGGTDPAKGLDCSGFVQRAYRDLGVELPRVSRDQAKAGTPVAGMAQAKPGDLIAFGRPVDHIGIYVGDGKMIVAPRKGDVVKVQDVYRAPTAIRRILPDVPATASAAPVAASAAPAALSAVAPLGRGESAYGALFAESGARHGVSPALLTAVARAESGFDPSARSPAGAQGLMQFMPATARSLGIDPWDPAQAVDGAARLLKENLQRFGSTELALAAYNAGPGAVSKHGGIPPYPETQNYVRKIMSELRAEAA